MKNKQTETIIAVIMTAFITSFTGSALNIAIPDIGAYFDSGAGVTSWIVTGYTAAVAVFSVPAGLVADKAGRKKIFITGIIIFGISSGGAAVSVSLMMLIICRGIQGIGAAMIFSTNTAILAEVYDESSRGRSLGYALAATYAGLSAGPVLGGIINQGPGWRYIFTIPAAVALISLLLSVRIPGCGKKETKSLTGAGIMGNKTFVSSSLAAFVNYGATFTLSYLLPVYLQVVRGCSSRLAGIIMLAQPVVISILSPPAGKKSDSVSPFKMAAAGMAVCGAGIGCCLIRVQEEAWLLPVIAALVITGAGSAVFSSPNTNAVMSAAGPENYGLASSVLSAMRALGNTAVMLIINGVSCIYLGDSVLKAAEPGMVVKTMTTVLALSAASCIPGTVLAIYRNRDIKSAKKHG